VPNVQESLKHPEAVDVHRDVGAGGLLVHRYPLKVDVLVMTAGHGSTPTSGVLPRLK
jgi:predicted aconitase with swiveling domain